MDDFPVVEVECWGFPAPWFSNRVESRLSFLKAYATFTCVQITKQRDV